MPFKIGGGDMNMVLGGGFVCKKVDLKRMIIKVISNK